MACRVGKEGIEPSPGLAEYGFTVRCNLTNICLFPINLVRESYISSKSSVASHQEFPHSSCIGTKQWAGLFRRAMMLKMMAAA
jgi:hypothetical protein